VYIIVLNVSNILLSTVIAIKPLSVEAKWCPKFVFSIIFFDYNKNSIRNLNFGHNLADMIWLYTSSLMVILWKQGRIKTRLGRMRLFRKRLICIWYSRPTKRFVYYSLLATIHGEQPFTERGITYWWSRFLQFYISNRNVTYKLSRV